MSLLSGGSTESRNASRSTTLKRYGTGSSVPGTASVARETKPSLPTVWHLRIFQFLRHAFAAIEIARSHKSDGRTVIAVGIVEAGH